MCSSVIKPFDHNIYYSRTNIILFSHSVYMLSRDKSRLCLAKRLGDNNNTLDGLEDVSLHRLEE